MILCTFNCEVYSAPWPFLAGKRRSKLTKVKGQPGKTVFHPIPIPGPITRNSLRHSLKGFQGYTTNWTSKIASEKILNPWKKFRLAKDWTTSSKCWPSGSSKSIKLFPSQQSCGSPQVRPRVCRRWQVMILVAQAHQLQHVVKSNKKSYLPYW